MAVPTTGQTHLSSVSGGVVVLLVLVVNGLDATVALLVLASVVVDVEGNEVDGSKVGSVELVAGKTVVFVS